MRIKYVGPHAEGVEVLDLLDLGFDVVLRDQPIDVPDDVAIRLLQQETNWTKAKPASTNTNGDS